MATELYPKAETQFVGPPEDVEAIRQCHRDWWAANNTKVSGGVVARARRNFAPDTLMFNLNGHTYYGLDEMVKVWEFYVGLGIDIDVCHLWDYRIFVDGDLAYITSEGSFSAKAEGFPTENLESGDGDVLVGLHFRETSIARRDDGEGNAVWKLWHFHCSPAAPADESRPGIDDTWTERGGARGGSIAQTAELPRPEGGSE